MKKFNIIDNINLNDYKTNKNNPSWNKKNHDYINHNKQNRKNDNHNIIINTN